MLVSHGQPVVWQASPFPSIAPVFSPEFGNRGVQGGGTKALVSSQPLSFVNVTCNQLLCTYMFGNHYWIQIGLACHDSNGGAAASETLIGGYICTIGGAAPQKQPREKTGLHNTAQEKLTNNCYTIFVLVSAFTLFLHCLYVRSNPVFCSSFVVFREGHFEQHLEAVPRR